MSAALCLTFALAGQCPTGYPAYTGYPMTSGYSSGTVYSAPAPYYAGPSMSYGHQGYGGSGYQGSSGYQSAGPGYAGGGAYGGQRAYDSEPGGYPQQPQAGYGAPPPQRGPQQGNVVQMTDRARFEPAQITVNVGDTVEWRNVSRHPHTVTADPNRASNPAHVVLPEGAQPVDSGEIPPGERFTYTFRTPGIYYYVCLPHEEQGMVGIVVVRPGGGQQRAGGGQPGGAGPRGQNY